MLSLADVTKTFHYRPVLQGVNFSLRAGTYYALMAPNGSGKTTLLRIMAGVSKPTEGRVLWGDKPLSTKSRQYIGAVFQAPMVYGDLSATENLMLFAELYGLKDTRELATEWVRRVRLQHALTQKTRDFSKGMLQRLAIARALIHQPQLILLDEPFDGLDADSVDLVKQLIEDQLAAGSTVVMVTHHADDALAAEERLTIRHGGVVCA